MLPSFMTYKLIRPPALRPGDTVAFVSPSGALRVPEQQLAEARAIVESLDLRVLVGKHALSHHGYLAGTDEERAADFNAAVRDPNVRAIFALRGGYGAMRLLEHIDYDALRADPKVLLGYSDITVLLNAVTARTGLVTFHGPVVAVWEPTPLALEWLRNALMSAQPLGKLTAPDALTITPGSAHGRLAGGNLSLISALSGTPYAVDFRDAIVLIEDIDELPYRIDRKLTQLRLSGALQSAAGFVVGTFLDCEAPEEAAPFSFSLEEVIRERLGDLGKPTIYRAPVGHIEEQWTLPIGATATLDASARTLTIE